MQRMRGGFTRGWKDVPIRYDSSGQGSLALVCCNGLGVSTSYWKYLLPHFARNHQVVTWEYRGHYTSGRPNPLDSENVSMTANAHDLASVLNACEIDKAVLIGHSMGCQVLFEFWRCYPERVAGLVPMCGPYGRPMDTFMLPPPVTTTLVGTLADLTSRVPGLVESVVRPVLRSPLPDIIARMGAINAELASPEDMAPYYANLSRMDLEVFFRMAIEMQKHDAGPWLKKINVPTLIVAGERDTFTPLELSTRMRDEIPDAEMLLLPKGSHAGLIEHPELINLRLEKFLQERVEPFLSRRKFDAKEKVARTKRNRRQRRAM